MGREGREGHWRLRELVGMVGELEEWQVVEASHAGQWCLSRADMVLKALVGDICCCFLGPIGHASVSSGRQTTALRNHYLQGWIPCSIKA